VNSKDIEKLTNDFKDYLLQTEIKDQIAKIILFGSHAKGTGTPDSDVDIFIFTTDGIGVEKALMNKVYDFIIEYNAPLEVLSSGIDELFLHPDYFLYNITHYGVEIYSMEKEEIKLATLKRVKDLAEEYYESAKEALERGRIRLAVDAAHNAAELAAKGLILLKQDDLPGSHGGVVSIFGQLYVKTDELDKEIGRALNEALRLRNLARYKPDARFTRDDAKNVLGLTERLLTVVSQKLKAREIVD
jgi:uncharacterized protein (UPF0332 family)